MKESGGSVAMGGSAGIESVGIGNVGNGSVGIESDGMENGGIESVGIRGTLNGDPIMTPPLPAEV